MEKVLESEGEFDVKLFERIIQCFYNPDDPDQKRAENVLLTFRDNPDSWGRTSAVMREALDIRSKLFALQVLERTVRVRWPFLVENQREGVRNYVVESILLQARQDQETPEKLVILKHLNQILIEIIKREWEVKWPTLITDLLAASQADSQVCRNTFELLGEFVDTIFNDPKDMVSAQVESLQARMKSEFPQIFRLVHSVLEKVASGEIVIEDTVITAGLGMLQQMAPHLSLEYILETNIVEVLCKYVETQFNIPVLQTFQGISRRHIEDPWQEKYFEKLRVLFVHTTAFVENYFQEFERIYKARLKMHYARMSDRDSMLIKEIVCFFCGVYTHAMQLEKMGCNTLSPLEPMIEISEVDDFELFKQCTEFWHQLVKDLYLEFPFAPAPPKQPAGLRRAKYAAILPKVVRVFVMQMTRPAEVIVREDDDGDLVLEKLSETDHLAHCSEMKETLFNISAITSGGLSSFLLGEAQSLFGSGWSRSRANKIAWAIGAVAESMSSQDERVFLIQALGVFIKLCEAKVEPVDRGIIASCILYIISQNPKFLQAYWKFLQITTVKIFEFIKEDYIGIPDMACETLLTIASKCGKEYEVVGEKGGKPIVEEYLQKVPDLLKTLGSKPYLTEILYEGFCYMVGSRVNELLGYTVQDVFSPNLASVEGIQRCIHAVRRIRVICTVQAGNDFCASREAAVQGIVEALLNVYNSSQKEAPGGAHLRRSISHLQRELLGLFRAIVEHFSIEFIRGRFSEACSQIILSPLSAERGFSPEELDILTSLCKRSIDLATPLITAVASPVGTAVLNDPSGKEELLKAFFRMICTFQKLQPRPSMPEVISWMMFGMTHTHREIFEGSVEVIVHIVNNGNIEMIRMVYMSLLAAVFWAALDKDHEGAINGLIEALAGLIRLSIEGRCPSQAEVVAAIGTGMKTEFRHLTSETVEQFFYGCYVSTNSHEKLAKVLEDFRIKIKTIV